jgi:hypothetical protein
MTIRTTRQRLEDTRAQAEGTGQENDTSALLVDAIRDQSRDPKARHRVEGRTSWESHNAHATSSTPNANKPTDPYLVGQHVKPATGRSSTQ